MPLPQSHIQDRLAMAYVQAVVAAAGAHYNKEEQPEYGMDCMIKKVVIQEDGSYNYSGYPLFCSIKSTTTWIEKEDRILYDLEADAYNKLVAWEPCSAILVVFRLPKEKKEWVTCTEDFLALRNCCYWLYLQGERTRNTRTHRVSLPRDQVFNDQAVNNLLNLLQQNKGSLS